MKELGETRSCHRANHLLLTPDTFVRAPLPGMKKVTAIVHASPRLGARFTQYTAEFEAGGELRGARSLRFVYVLEGALRILERDLTAGDYAYLHQDYLDDAVASQPSRALVIEKDFDQLIGTLVPDSFFGSVDKITAQPLMGDPSVQVQPLIPDSPSFDFAVNFMSFDPGASLPLVEIHVMEHGLQMISGGGIYRLGDCWHPVTAGDFIYMAPFCPQWFCAVGKTPAQYIIYKDWNRHAD